MVRGLGQTLITLGLVVLVFVGYELWWTGFTTQRDQHRLLTALRQQWAVPVAATTVYHAPKLGEGIAILRIPRLGAHYRFVVVQGTDTADLIKGPGHYVGSALPGQLGNFSVAGHRTTYLHPFYDIDKLRVGDPIVLETRTTWFTYRVRDVPGTTAKYQEIVPPTDLSVAYPVPDQADSARRAKVRALTFTSCNPRYSAEQRIVVHGVLASKQPVSAGPPAALRS